MLTERFQLKAEEIYQRKNLSLIKKIHSKVFSLFWYFFLLALLWCHLTFKTCNLNKTLKSRHSSCTIYVENWNHLTHAHFLNASTEKELTCYDQQVFQLLIKTSKRCYRMTGIELHAHAAHKIGLLNEDLNLLS